MRVIGLMSGTSVDGVDAALVDIREGSAAVPPRLIAFRVFPFPRAVREEIFRASHPGTSDVEMICSLNVRLGEVFAGAALAIAAEASLPIREVGLIGSHGQTISHLPSRGCTLQIGEPSIIAERTGVTTIADFRPRDVAAGGHGAPLTPFLHHRLFAAPRVTRAVQNIGGISNVTVLPRGGGPASLLAFDTGPGNMVIDGIVARGTGRRYDKDGRLAGGGRVNEGLLRALLAHPYLRRRPPKTTGREEFGEKLVARIREEGRKRRLSLADLVATATAFTAESIALAYRRFILPRWSLSEVIVGGGGVKNRTLMSMIGARMAGVRVSTFEDYGLNSDAVEAMAFALLAYEAYRGRTNNYPSATGARRAVVMGKIVPGGAGWSLGRAGRSVR